MCDIPSEKLRAEINAMLMVADLSVVTAKKVREHVEKKLNCSLHLRKKEFDSIVMEFINKQHLNDDEDTENGNDEEDDDGEVSEPMLSSEEDSRKKKPKKRPQATQRKVVMSKKKRKSLNAPDSGTETDGGSDSDFEVPKKQPVKKKSSGSSAIASSPSGTVRKSTGFTRAYALSPELSALMGTDSLPRHEVVKKVWAIIKERNLYDPKNKQFAICDDELMTVMKVKRFRTFGMLKHLKPHFLG